MQSMQILIQQDAYRINARSSFSIKSLKGNDGFMVLYYFRKSQGAKNKFLKKFYRHLFFNYAKTNGIEIPESVEVGGGLLLIHPYNITINSKAHCGRNLTLLKGCTIGNAKGKKEGAPTIGDDVYIGLNATVVGKITIGNDVLIAPNSFVNFDVPSHSVVIGNPGVIHHKEQATLDYIINRINLDD